MNKFNRIINSNFYEIDMFISSFNAHCIDDVKVDSLPIIDSRSRTVSFHLMSMDTFTVFSHKYYTEYRYLERLSKLMTIVKAKSFFIKTKNDNICFMLYDNIYSSLNNFFVKNINRLSFYTYIFKLYFFDSKAFFNNILKYNLHNYNSLLFFYVNIFNEIYTYNASFKFKYNFNNSLSKKLKFLFFFYEGLNNFIFSKSLNKSSVLFKNKQKSIKKSYHKLLYRYSKPKRIEHTVHHSYNINRLPARIYTAVSRFPYQPTGILYTNVSANYRYFSYREKGLYQYYRHMYVFYNVVFSFFRRNLVKGILNNNLLNPKFLISKFFTLFKYYKLYITRDRVQRRFKKFIFEKLRFNKNLFKYLLGNDTEKLCKIVKKYKANAGKIVTFKFLLPRNKEGYKLKKKLKKLKALYSLENKLNKIKKIFSLTLQMRSYLLLNSFVGSNLTFVNADRRRLQYRYFRKNISRNLLRLLSRIKKILRRRKINKKYLLKNFRHHCKLKASTLFILNKRADTSKRLSSLINLKKSKLKHKPLYYYINLQGKLI